MKQISSKKTFIYCGVFIVLSLIVQMISPESKHAEHGFRAVTSILIFFFIMMDNVE